MSDYKRRTDPRTGKRFFAHRAIAEWHLGRPLEPDEIVHHVNEDKGDDHPLNLRVLPSARVHALLHWYLRREAQGVQHLWPLEVWLEVLEVGSKNGRK